MSFLKRLLRREDPPVQAVQESRPCLHVSLVPQWATPEDIGKEERASRFLCSTCSKSFTPDETRELRASEAERLRSVVGN